MYCNIAAYQFVALDEDQLIILRDQIQKFAMDHAIKGTVLLSKEGINLFLASLEESIDKCICFLNELNLFPGMLYKKSYSEFIPFKKLNVRIRKEIVTFRQDHICPEEQTAPYITPKALVKKLEQQEDIILLDTRNEFEFGIGSFETAIHLNLENFCEFTDKIAKANLDKTKPVVTFCTGGIRCEKAAAYLLQQGFQEVYQLEGGILNYLEQCTGKFYQGNCFVFDDRVALDQQLRVAD